MNNNELKKIISVCGYMKVEFKQILAEYFEKNFKSIF